MSLLNPNAGRRVFTRLVLAWLAIWSTATLDADSLKVIANPALGITEISAADLKSVYLLNKTRLNGQHVDPVLDSGSLRAFSAVYLGKTDHGLEIYYRSRVFTGQGAMPLHLGNGADVVAHVARTPGAIGFIHEDTPAAGVKTLRVR